MSKPRTTDKLRICEKQCDECLFSKNKVVSDDRKNEILRECANTGVGFTCHKASIEGENIMCKGFYEMFKDSSIVILFGSALNLLEFVPIPKSK